MQRQSPRIIGRALGDWRLHAQGDVETDPRDGEDQEEDDDRDQGFHAKAFRSALWLVELRDEATL